MTLDLSMIRIEPVGPYHMTLTELVESVPTDKLVSLVLMLTSGAANPQVIRHNIDAIRNTEQGK